MIDVLPAEASETVCILDVRRCLLRGLSADVLPLEML